MTEQQKPFSDGWLRRDLEEAEWRMSLYEPGTLKFKPKYLAALKAVDAPPQEK